MIENAKPAAETTQSTPPWYVYKGAAGKPLPPAPPWRSYDTPVVEYPIPPADADDTFQPDDTDIAMVNAALYLRRPLLVTGRPGSGKSSLAGSIARELGLGRVLVWPINSRSTLQEGLYQYDALARLQDASRRRAEEGGSNEKSTSIGQYLRLGALGTALLPRMRPRVLLIDEIDKSDIDLPNDLLHVFERGRFEIPELSRVAKEKGRLSVSPCDSDVEVVLDSGEIRCREFPIVILTSNGERDFPPAFLRRCLRLDMRLPDETRLRRIVEAHFRGAQVKDAKWVDGVNAMLKRFLELRDQNNEMIATDQLLNALHFVRSDVDLLSEKRTVVLDAVLRGLISTGAS
ncbi:AAA family ATPase [Sorangium sp. So ce385]|uniref:AAA family ATPase n=1 Tax=Sorangium sp. So ce385 TaxID=3133308 RepID=UPI003F5BFBFF